MMSKYLRRIHLKRRDETIKISYDKEVDAIYLKILDLKPEGLIEVAEGINIDVTGDGKIVGIEFLKNSGSKIRSLY